MPHNSLLNPVQPSDFMKNDIPAETDDLELGRRNPDATEEDVRPAPGTRPDRAEDNDLGR